MEKIYLVSADIYFEEYGDDHHWEESEDVIAFRNKNDAKKFKNSKRKLKKFIKKFCKERYEDPSNIEVHFSISEIEIR